MTDQTFMIQLHEQKLKRYPYYNIASIEKSRLKCEIILELS